MRRRRPGTAKGRRRRSPFDRRRRRSALAQWRGAFTVMLLAAGAVLLFEERRPDFAGRQGVRVISGADRCAVTAVIDGDTVQARCPRQARLTVRLVGLDAPEIFSPQCASELRQGLEAKRALARMLEGADALRFDFRGTDKYDRQLARLFADGADLAERMVAAGHARRYSGEERGAWCS
jgi:micrococcal nuclease